MTAPVVEPVTPPAPATGVTPAVPDLPVVPPVEPPVNPPVPVVEPPVVPEVPAVVAPVVPETYDLKLPAESKLDAAIVERTATTARALGLSNEAGQKLLDSVVAEFAAKDAALVSAWEPMKGEAWKQRDSAWKATALADAEIGGSPEKLETSATLAKQVVEKFFDPKITEFLRVSGLGSHPEYIRGLARIGRGMSEGSLVLGSSGTTPKPKDAATVLYGEDGMGPKPNATKE